MKPNAKLRAARESAGKTLEDVAEATGVDFSCYRDIEDYGDELYTSVSLSDIRRIAEYLHLTAGELFSDDLNRRAGEKVNGFSALAQSIRDSLQSRRLTLAEFEDQAGWELTDFMENPNAVWESWNIDCLRHVSRELGVDWLSVLEYAFTL